MAQKVLQYCLTGLSALVTNHTYGIAVTVGGIMHFQAVVILMMLALTVIDVSGIQRSILDCKI